MKKESNNGKVIRMNPRPHTENPSRSNKNPKVISIEKAKSDLHKAFIDNILQNSKSF